MQDMLTQLERLRRDAAECELIRDLATDHTKRELFDRLAAHLSVLASEVERTMLEGGRGNCSVGQEAHVGTCASSHRSDRARDRPEA
jgi:hypothetical protein